MTDDAPARVSSHASNQSHSEGEELVHPGSAEVVVAYNYESFFRR